MIRWILTSMLLLMAMAAGADTLRVPADHATVQAAIDASQDGDVIELAPGIYAESLNLRGGITLLGTGAKPEDVIIEGLLEHPVGQLRDDERLLVLENLRIRYGFATRGGGLYLENARVRMDRVEIWDCGSMLEGGAIFARNVDLEANFCVLYRNYSWGTDGAAIYMEGEGPLGEGQRFQNCTFAGTSLCCGNASLYIRLGSPEFQNCILERILCGEGATPYLACNNGDFCGIDGGGHVPGDASFCDLEGGDLRLESYSQCLPANSGGCGLIGALGTCVDESAAETTSFSVLKTLY